MNQEEANLVLHKMSKVIDNSQMMSLNTVLEEIVSDTITEVPMKSSQELLESFLATKRLEGRSEQTLDLYRFTIEKLIQSVDKNICTLSTEDIRAYLMSYQLNKGISKATMDNIRRNLSSLYKWLEDENYIFKSPLRRIHKIKTRKVVKEAFSDEEIERLKDGCKYQRDLVIFEFLFSTGIRIGELIRLNRDNIDFEERECIVLGKGDKERIAYFDARTKLHLQEYLSSRKDDNPALFVSIRQPARRLTAGGVEIMMNRLGKRCDVEKCHPHRCRRTCATSALEKGMPLEQVRVLLGHEQIATTLMYCRVNDSTVKSSHRKYLG